MRYTWAFNAYGANMLSYDEVVKFLSYDPSSGELHWKLDSWAGFKKSAKMHSAGDPAGCVRSDGRVVVRVCGKLYMRYRLAWLINFGMWPDGEIDHINGDRADDRMGNLRIASRSMNQENIRKALSSNKSSRLLGAYKNKPGRAKPWRSSISIKGKHVGLGYFHTAEEAHQAYLNAKRVLHEGCTI